MTIPSNSGYLDSSNNLIRPASSDTWSAHSGYTWDSWTSWDKPQTSIIWAQSIVDLGRIRNFTLNITTNSTGLVSYQVFVSNTGLFQGEESSTTISQGATNVSSFSGRYILVIVTSIYNNQTLTLGTCKITPVTDSVVEMRYSDLDSSTLSGTSSSRTLALTQTVSQIVDLIITPHEVTSYALDVYVSSTSSSTFVLPKIISKSISGPTFALVGLDNKPRDAIVDIVVKALPAQYMTGNNLVSS